jgi:hypothetical protein
VRSSSATPPPTGVELSIHTVRPRSASRPSASASRSARRPSSVTTRPKTPEGEGRERDLLWTVGWRGHRMPVISSRRRARVRCSTAAATPGNRRLGSPRPAAGSLRLRGPRSARGARRRRSGSSGCLATVPDWADVAEGLLVPGACRPVTGWESVGKPRCRGGRTRSCCARAERVLRAGVRFVELEGARLASAYGRSYGGTGPARSRIG